LADSAKVLSNADVRARVHGAARTFAYLGVGRGDVVAVMLPNRVELLVTLLAAWRLGAAVPPSNPAPTPAEAPPPLTDPGAPRTAHRLPTPPLCHANGLVVGSLTPLLAGGRVTIADRFDPSTFFSVVERVRPTYFSAVPTIYAMLSALPDDVVPDTSSLRVAICGAAPMPAELIGRFETRFGVPIVEGYGLSEGSCASTVNPIDGRRKPGTVGLPMPGQQIAILGNDGTHVTDGSVTVGTVGEVLIKGPNVMRG